MMGLSKAEEDAMAAFLHTLRQTKYGDRFPVGMKFSAFWAELEKLVKELTRETTT